MKIRRKLGAYLKKLRFERNMTLNEVVAYLSILNIKTSHSTLSRIESDYMLPRSDIIAGLALVYKMETDEILFKK
jgi:transcriptional regulator with XRE-family HTH domain